MECMNCGKQLTRKQERDVKRHKSTKWYCSRNCAGKANTLHFEKMYCIRCGKELTRKQKHNAKRNKRVKCYCSRKCYYESIKGVPLSEEWCKNISIAQTGKKRLKIYYEKLYCMFCGKELTEKQEQRIRYCKGTKWYCSCKCFYEARKGTFFSKEHCRKMRIATLKNIANNNGAVAGYNKKACELFEWLDELMETDGIYATHPQELQVIGYSLDYINHDKKLIIEYDEKYHNNQIEKDAIRQQRIQKHFPEYIFIRFKEEELSILMNHLDYVRTL